MPGQWNAVVCEAKFQDSQEQLLIASAGVGGAVAAVSTGVWAKKPGFWHYLGAVVLGSGVGRIVGHAIASQRVPECGPVPMQQLDGGMYGLTGRGA